MHCELRAQRVPDARQTRVVLFERFQHPHEVSNELFLARLFE